MTLFPGLLRPKGAGPEFTPLLRTERHRRHDRLERCHPAELHGHFGGINPRPRRSVRDVAYTLAARLQGLPPTEPARKDGREGEEGPGQEAPRSTSSPSPTST